MPTQLLQRLTRFLDANVAQHINALERVARVDTLGAVPPNDPLRPNEPAPNIRPHWKAGPWGNVMGDIRCVMVHETSGWPSYESSNNFRQLYECVRAWAWSRRLQRWVDRRGIGPQYFVDPAGTTFVLIGPENLDGDARRTIHGEGLNEFSLGIENADVGDGVDPGHGAGPRWWLLSTIPEAEDDVPGQRVFLVLHPGGNRADANLIWFARLPRYTGSGDIQNIAARYPDWLNMLFTERNYRSLALLCRLLAEQHDLPRNFLLLPYMKLSHDSTSAAVFRQLILAEQNGEAIATELGSSRDIVQAGGPVFQNWFAQNPGAWSRFFRPRGPAQNPQNTQNVPSFRGFLSHDVNGTHNCPGPLFDWHRLAREVWDWWWYPFDLEPGGQSVSATMRPYRQARGDTQLREYYYDASGTANNYNNFRQPLQTTERFILPAFTPVFAMSNGVVVAARFALSSALAPVSFVLIRHEVFHTQRGDRINYDAAPTYVWSMISFLSQPGFTVETTSPDNPDWLNRFAIRLKECELAVEFHRRVISAGATHPANATLRHAWTHPQAGGGPRLATGAEIERDATEYRAIAANLAAGRFALFPLESEPAPTPVRVLLGDYLGTPNRIPGNADGIQVEIFSRDRLDGPVSTQQPVSAAAEDWWRAAAAATRHEGSADADLPADGNVWNYTLTDFLHWVNGVTWASEWPKYGVVDSQGAPAPLPARPVTRIVV